MVQKKLAKPIEKKFEHVDWAKYKNAAISITRVEAVPFVGVRTSNYLHTGFGELNLGKLEDRRFIRETQRTIRSGFSDKLYGIFEATVLEIVAFMKKNGVVPGDREFESEVLKYAKSVLSDLQSAEAAMLRLMPEMPPEKRAELDARSGKWSGGYKN